METKELVALLTDLEGQQNLYERAKAGESQAMLDFVRFSVLKKIVSRNIVPMEEAMKLFESVMGIVHLIAEDFNG